MRSGHDGAMTTEPSYTLVQYAVALDISVQAAHQAFGPLLLAAEPKPQIDGQRARALPVRLLPKPIRQRLAAKAAAAGCRDAEAWLALCTAAWQPKIPVAELTAACLEKAVRRREALAPALRAAEPDTSLAALTCRAHRAFLQLCPEQRPAERSVRRWLERARRRDRGRGEWQRLELYLDERLIRRGSAEPTRSADPLKAGPLHEALDLLACPPRARHEDQHHLWCAAMEEIDRRVEGGQSVRAARAAALAALGQAPTPLARNREALRKSLARKHRRWRQSGGGPEALKDHRTEVSGHRRSPALPEADRQRLLARTLGCGGRLTQAYRELWDEGRLPAAFYQTYTRDACEKSRVPQAVRDLFPADFLAQLQREHLGKRVSALHGPKCVRDWSAMPAGVQAQSDDCTLPVYFWIPAKDGSFKLLRGQFLPWIDTRTTYIHCFQLLPTESYGSLDIVRGVVRLHDEFGLPPELYFERGIWQRSLVIAGRGDEVPWKQRVYGLRDLGVRLSQALDPAAKVVERALGALQNCMERERGYCGRDERRDCPEAVAKAKRAVEAGRCHPGECFYSCAEWVARLNALCDAYNDEPQGGKMLAGRSPRQAFVQLQAEPPIRLDETTRYLLASHRRVEKVSARGLTVRIGKAAYTYKSEATGRLIGQRVLAWFDVEDPSLITLTTLDRKDPVTVARETVLPAWRASAEAIAQAKRENVAHLAPLRRLYSTLRKECPEELGRRTARPVLASDATRGLGAEIDRQKTAMKTEATRTQRTRAAVHEQARRVGLPLPWTDDPRRLEAQRKLVALMRRREPAESPNPVPAQ
jgi:hypothetical protein